MKTTVLCAVLGLFLLATGCGVSAPLEGRADPYVPPQVAFASPDLVSRTAVGLPIMERRNGLLYVTVPIRSANNLDLHIDYQVIFLNAQGTPIDTSPWKGGTTLQSHVPTQIQFNSVSADAANFRLNIRYSE